MSFTNLSGKFISLGGKLIINAVGQFSMRNGISGFDARSTDNYMVDFRIGTTWKTFIESQLNDLPIGCFSVNANNEVILVSFEDENEYVYVYTASNEKVWSTDIIENNAEYFFR